MQLEDFAASPNLVALFLARADLRGDAPFLWTRATGGAGWAALSWAEAARRVCTIAENLVALGIGAGDRVLLVSENRPEWCLADLAIMAAGAITVPAYVTNTERDHLHVVENSGAAAAIVSTAKLAKPLLAAIARGGEVGQLIHMEPLPRTQAGAAEHVAWDRLLEGDAAAARTAVEARIAGIARGDPACIIYTSGTGGAPRGVVQHHGAILHNVAGAAAIIAEDFGWDTGSPGEVFLSFLPLSHAYEHSAGQFLPIGLGGQIYYSEGLDRLAANIAEVRPTIMVVVPRLFEVLRQRMLRQMDGRLARLLLGRALAQAKRGRSSGWGAWRDPALDALLGATLRRKVRARFGGRIKALVSGGAPLAADVGRFFNALGLTLLQGYGQTEAGPVVSCNRPAAGLTVDTVGPPLAGVTVRIADDGEICVQGELVMHGYWRNPAETRRALQGGWLMTGDIGHLDARGRIVITDRKKDMIVNDKGDNISPQRVEGLLTLEPEIAQAMVWGDRQPYVVALVVPAAEWASEWAAAHGVEPAKLHEDEGFRRAVRAALDRVNGGLSVIERVRRFAFADEAFGIDNGEMTPSLKIKRHRLKERYGARLNALYKS